jgi:fumarylpyruvate hydrolase
VTSLFVFPPPAVPAVPVAGTDALFPVHRIYCVGRNYAEHAREMGAAVDRQRPTFFAKPADAVWTKTQPIPYPPATRELHHEVELVVALGAGGAAVDAARAPELVFGYAVGLDLTRRDLQAAAKAAGGPWDTAKGFDHSAPLAPIARATDVGHPTRGLLWLEVNGSRRQEGEIADMIFPVAELLSLLSQLFTLQAGDLVFTGTPAGVGPLVKADQFRAGFPGLPLLEGSLA